MMNVNMKRVVIAVVVAVTFYACHSEKEQETAKQNTNRHTVTFIPIREK